MRASWIHLASLSHRFAVPALALGGLVLAACPADEHAGHAAAPAEAQPVAESQSPAEAQSPPAPTAVAQPIPDAGSFALVTDQDRSKLTWRATADGREVRGEVSLIVGGLYLVDGDLDGATGSISGNLRYIQTGRPMWDQYLSESFFEALQPEREMAHAGIDRIRLPAASERSAPRRGEAEVTLGLARGSQKFAVAIEVTTAGQALRLRSAQPTALDLVTLGYSERLEPLAQALGRGEVTPKLLIEFDLYLEPMSSHAAGRSLP